MNRLNSLEDTVNKNQMLFGINQGAIYADIRIDHAKRISSSISTAMQSEVSQSGKHMRKCTIFWMRQFLICRERNQLI